MRNFDDISTLVKNRVLSDFDDESENHVVSGKLSASSLYKPTLFQVLHYLEVPTVFDIYSKMRFKRGKDVETNFLNLLPVLSRQEVVEYRFVVGKIDAVMAFTGLGRVPVEVKSVTREKFKRIEAEGKADEQWCFQSTLYALGMKQPRSIVTVVNSSDYRNLSYLIEVKEYKDVIDKIIDEYDMALKKRIMPIFKARYKWMENQLYQDYPQFSTLTTEKEILELLKKDYPESYKKWLSGK